MEKINCNVIQDILPLYIDDVVSDDTKELVEEHRNDDKNDQGPHNVIGLGNEQINSAFCERHYEVLLSLVDSFCLLYSTEKTFDQWNIRAVTKPISASTSTRARPMNMMVWILPDISG